MFGSVWNMFGVSKSFVVSEKSASKNNSFHRIYDADSDVSDESDVESDLNTSVRSNASFKSNQSFLDFNSTLNASFTSKAPSVRSMSTRSLKMPLRGSMGVLNATSPRPLSRLSNADLGRDTFDPTRNMYASTQSLNRPASHFGSASQMGGSMNPVVDGRCISRLSMNDIPDEFESGITQLSIGATTAKRQFYQNQARHAPSVASLRHRHSVLMPARLDLDGDQQERASLSAHQTSWLAGGYWSTSPTKRQSAGHIPAAHRELRQQVHEVFPVMSRTSSQSSGFESMKNGLENPLAANDHEAMESDVSLPLFSGNSFQSISAQKSMPHNPFSNGFQTSNFPPNELNWSSGRSSARAYTKNALFDTSSLQMQLPIRGAGRETLQFPAFGNDFNKFSNTAAQFPRGNLLKIPKAGQQDRFNSHRDITANDNCFASRDS